MIYSDLGVCYISFEVIEKWPFQISVEAAKVLGFLRISSRIFAKRRGWPRWVFFRGRGRLRAWPGRAGGVVAPATRGATARGSLKMPAVVTPAAP